MKKLKNWLLVIIVLISIKSESFGQCLLDHGDFSMERTGTIHSYDGFYLNPIATYGVLNIFINIIYDQTPERDYAKYHDNGPWDRAFRGPVNGPYNCVFPGVNVGNQNTCGSNSGFNLELLPSYLIDFMDHEYTGSTNVRGRMTKIYYESSFGKLIVIGDNIVVNILQSYITPQNPGGNFLRNELISKTVEIINDAGFNTLNGNNDPLFYDRDGDGDFDFVQVLVRNPHKKAGLFNYGDINYNGGNSGSLGNAIPKVNVGGTQLRINSFSYQGVGDGQVPLDPNGIVIHELAHNFLGHNNFHTSGGDHWSSPPASTFLAQQGGYGLMGGGFSSLVSCNGFERWRLNWTSDIYNPSGIPIAALDQNNLVINSDIDNTVGNQTFYIRDFVSYGDAIRIKLPYTDNLAENQYIWIENHQVGKNDKLDWNVHTDNNSCPTGSAGAHMYVQVGTDILEGSASQVYHNSTADNLKSITADGYWDTRFDGIADGCNGANRTTIEYLQSNPLSGTSDLITNFYDNNSDGSLAFGEEKPTSNKKINGIVYHTSSSSGDNEDAFLPGTEINVSTNPTPSNVKTYYCVKYRPFTPTIKPSNKTNTEYTYLTGLNIKFSSAGSNQFGDILKVDIGWNHNTIDNDVRWTGKIKATEDFILTENHTIHLDQNYTALQRDKDPLTNEFSEHTSLHLINNSTLKLEEGSVLNVSKNSAIVIENGSVLEIGEDAELLLNDGAMLKIENGGLLKVTGSGRVIVGSNVNLCMRNASVFIPAIELQDPLSTIYACHNLVYGLPTNSYLNFGIPCSTNSLANYPFIGLGQIFMQYPFSAITPINAKIYNNDAIEAQRRLIVNGPVLIQNNADVEYHASEYVLIKQNFEVIKGAEFEIRVADVCD